ncbi:hypothetical protein NC651_037271 [Populus alba x Populus x berolinensis]|nr:hypothetical protein NC651_037271 [Populus alba x Populus x berolinensis]
MVNDESEDLVVLLLLSPAAAGKGEDPVLLLLLLSCFVAVNTLPQTLPRLEAKFVLKTKKSSFGHRLSKQISKLMCNGNMMCNKFPKSYAFAYKMIIKFNMLATSMENRIDRHMECTEIITIEYWWRYQGNV